MKINNLYKIPLHLKHSIKLITIDLYRSKSNKREYFCNRVYFTPKKGPIPHIGYPNHYAKIILLSMSYWKLCRHVLKSSASPHILFFTVKKQITSCVKRYKMHLNSFIIRNRILALADNIYLTLPLNNSLLIKSNYNYWRELSWIYDWHEPKICTCS